MGKRSKQNTDTESQSLNILLALRQETEEKSRLAILSERSHLAKTARINHSREDTAYIYFVSQLTSALVSQYGFYVKIKDNDTLWNDLCRLVNHNMLRIALDKTLGKAASAATKAIGVDENGQEIATTATSALVNTAALLYEIYDKNNRKKQIKAADKFLALAPNSADFAVLVTGLVIKLFNRLKLGFCQLTAPEGRDDLIKFLVKFIHSTVVKMEIADIPTTLVEKEALLFRLAIPPINSPKYYLFQILGKNGPTIKIGSNPAVREEHEDDNKWSFVGVLREAPILVKSGNIVYGNQNELRYDIKYPSHFIVTQDEATRSGAVNVAEFIWSNLSKGKKINVDKDLKVTAKMAACLSELLRYAEPEHGLIWLNEQLCKIAQVHWDIFKKHTDADIKKKVFFNLLGLSEKLQKLAGGKFNLSNLYTCLPNMISLLFYNSNDKEDDKWKERQARVDALCRPSPLALHLAEAPLPAALPLERAMVLHANRSSAPAVIEINPVVLGAGVGSGFPELPTMGAADMNLPLLNRVQTNSNEVKVDIWRQSNRCVYISIKTNGDNPFHGYFSNKAIGDPSHLKSFMFRGKPVYFYNTLDMPPAPSTYSENKKRPYTFSCLQVKAIEEMYIKLIAGDPAAAGAFEQYFNHKIYGQHHEPHLHVPFFLLVVGGLLSMHASSSRIASIASQRYIQANGGRAIGFLYASYRAVRSARFDSMYTCIKDAAATDSRTLNAPTTQDIIGSNPG